ncbi:histone deacetylase family protein [Egicoccus halophilus]|uniref:Acetylpolyamine amidohydrolase n=1 Tax=Egicoccus halophilus TaxID=1670830 RepID=A0A8J3AB64_9ACTN|nr:histone deacetylase family protein [Egicoccus halophilus]GGI09271.1 acetylpolyamine amidohydrolase [Egicoccus halophilus]
MSDAAPGPVPVVVDDTHHRHDPPFELNAGRAVSPVWERPARLEAIGDALAAAGHPRLPASAWDDAPLLAVHDPDLVAFLRDGHAAWRAAGGPPVMIADTFRHPRMGGGGRRPTSPLAEPGWWCFDTATPLVEGSFAAGRAAVDVALSAAALVAEGAPAVYGLTRPPGHHAGADYFGGFCLFNHAAVAARWLTAAGRVTVLDLDVHHGNGTQDVFWEDPQVQYVSLHGDPAELFPYLTGFADERGAGRGRGTTLNLPLPTGTDDDAYLEALRLALEAVDAFDPATVVVSLGLDTTAEDPIGSLSLSADAFARIGAALAALGRPTVVLQEGGYAIDRLGPSAVAVLAGLGGGGPRPAGDDLTR